MKGGEPMKKIVIGALFVVCAAVVTAPAPVCDTPLYTVRMEQVSNNMHFLPTEVTPFVYTAERGCTVTGTVVTYCSGQPLSTGSTFCPTCEPQDTCSGTCESCQQTCGTCWLTCPETCDLTCFYTCWPTCGSTCPNTCSTCEETCSTCPLTCRMTCNTCYETCENCDTTEETCQ